MRNLSYVASSQIHSQPVASYVQTPKGGGIAGGLEAAAKGLQAWAELEEKSKVRQEQVGFLRAQLGARREIDRLVADFSTGLTDTPKGYGAVDVGGVPAADGDESVGIEPDWNGLRRKFAERKAAITQRWSAGLQGQDREKYQILLDEELSKGELEFEKQLRLRQIDHGRATLDRFVDDQLKRAYRAGDDEDRSKAILDGRAAIRAAQSSGVISAVDAVKRERDLVAGHDRQMVLGLIRTDPERAIDALTEPKVYPNLPDDARERFLRVAQQRADAVARDGIEATRRAERDADRDLRRAQVQTEAAIIGRLAGAGEPVTEAELSDLAARQRISDDAWRMLRGELRAGREGIDNPNVVTGLVSGMVREGRDIYGELVRERERGNLSRDTFVGLVERNQKAIEGRGRDTFKTGEQQRQFEFVDNFIAGGKSILQLDDDTRQRRALALREYSDRAVFGDEGPRDVANDVIAKYAKVISVLPRSSYFDPPKSQGDVQAIGNRLRSLRAGGLMPEETYQEQMRLLRQAAEALGETPPARPAGKPAKPRQ